MSGSRPPVEPDSAFPHGKEEEVAAEVMPVIRDATKVVRGGVEPPTFRFSGGRSYQLSYLTKNGRRD